MISYKLKRLPPVLSHWTCCDDGNSLHLCSPNMVAISHIGRLSTWNVVSMTEESNFLFYFILITLNVNSRVLVSTTLDSTVLDSAYTKLSYTSVPWIKVFSLSKMFMPAFFARKLLLVCRNQLSSSYEKLSWTWDWVWCCFSFVLTPTVELIMHFILRCTTSCLCLFPSIFSIKL